MGIAAGLGLAFLAIFFALPSFGAFQSVEAELNAGCEADGLAVRFTALWAGSTAHDVTEAPEAACGIAGVSGGATLALTENGAGAVAVENNLVTLGQWLPAVDSPITTVWGADLVAAGLVILFLIGVYAIIIL